MPACTPDAGGRQWGHALYPVLVEYNHGIGIISYQAIPIGLHWGPNYGEAGSRLEVHRRGEYQSSVPKLSRSRVIKLMDRGWVTQPWGEYRGKYQTIFAPNIAIRLGLESSNWDNFFISSYTNNSRSGKFLTNSEARSSYSPKFAGDVFEANCSDLGLNWEGTVFFQEETQQQLFKELKLKVLLIENFIPPSEKLKLLSRIGYDEEEDTWKLSQVTTHKSNLILEALQFSEDPKIGIV